MDAQTDGRSGPITRPAFPKVRQVTMGSMNLQDVQMATTFTGLENEWTFLLTSKIFNRRVKLLSEKKECTVEIFVLVSTCYVKKTSLHNFNI